MFPASVQSLEAAEIPFGREFSEGCEELIPWSKMALKPLLASALKSMLVEVRRGGSSRGTSLFEDDLDGVVKVMMMIMIMIMMMMLMMMMKLVTDMALTEMFSGVAEEKEVRKITGKVLEARGSECYDMLQIMARFIDYVISTSTTLYHFIDYKTYSK